MTSSRSLEANVSTRATRLLLVALFVVGIIGIGETPAKANTSVPFVASVSGTLTRPAKRVFISPAAVVHFDWGR